MGRTRTANVVSKSSATLLAFLLAVPSTGCVFYTRGELIARHDEIVATRETGMRAPNVESAYGLDPNLPCIPERVHLIDRTSTYEMEMTPDGMLWTYLPGTLGLTLALIGTAFLVDPPEPTSYAIDRDAYQDQMRTLGGGFLGVGGALVLSSAVFLLLAERHVEERERLETSACDEH